MSTGEAHCCFGSLNRIIGPRDLGEGKSPTEKGLQWVSFSETNLSISVCLYTLDPKFWFHCPMGHLRVAFSVIFPSFHIKSRRKTHFSPFPHTGFRRKEFRGKLAIAITANFINRNSTAEAKVEEISGVAFIFNQKFFQDLKEETGGTFTFLQSRLLLMLLCAV